MAITVYTKPACVQCNATYKALDKHGLSYEVVDISTDDEARDYVMALGYLQRRWSWSAMTTGRDSVPTASRRSPPTLPEPAALVRSGGEVGIEPPAGRRAATCAVACPVRSTGAGNRTTKFRM